MTMILNKIRPVRAATGNFTVDGGWTIEVDALSFTITNNFDVDNLIQITCLCDLFDPFADTINGQGTYFLNLMVHDYLAVEKSVYPVFVKDEIIHAFGSDLKHYQFDMDGILISNLDWITATPTIIYAATTLNPDIYYYGFANVENKVGLFLHCEYRGLRVISPEAVVRMVVNTSEIDVGFIESFEYLDNFFIEPLDYGGLPLISNQSSDGVSFAYALNSLVVPNPNLFICYFGFYGASNRIDLDENFNGTPPPDLYASMVPIYDPDNAAVAKYGQLIAGGGALTDYTNGITFASLSYPPNQSDVEYNDWALQINYAASLYDYFFVNVLGETAIVESFIAYLLDNTFIEFSDSFQNGQILLATGNVGVLVLDILGNPYYLSTGDIEPTELKKPPRWFPCANYSRLI